MVLRNSWWPGRFIGTCIDDDVVLQEDPPRVIGRLRGPKITLQKLYREAWVITPERTQTFREWLSESGFITDSPIRPQVVTYTGTVDRDQGTAQGVWRLEQPEFQVVVEGQWYVVPADHASGTWTMERE